MIEETEYDDTIECHHSYDQRCHTTYTTDYEPQQEEECDENFVKNCYIEYKQARNYRTITLSHDCVIMVCSKSCLCEV